jgi:hypothetical protein
MGLDKYQRLGRREPALPSESQTHRIIRSDMSSIRTSSTVRLV